MINKNFTLLWSGKIISQLGDKFYAIALAWWIMQKTNLPTIMGLFLLTTILPSVLLGFFAGALTDRWNKKAMMVVTDIIRGGFVLIIAFMAMVGFLEVWQVFVIAFCLSIATAFFEPAIQAILPEIVEKENLTKANGMSQMVSGICTVAGPLMGSIAVSMFGIAWVFIANSISYFISAFFACFIVMNKTNKNFNEKNFLWKDIYEGIQFLKNKPNILSILKIIAIAHFFMGSLMVCMPFLAKGLEGNGIKNLGYLEMMMGIGLIMGSIFISVNKKASINEGKLILFIMLVGICFLIVSVEQFFRVKLVYGYMVEMGIIGGCIAFASVFWQSLLQNYTPAYMTGRVFSVSSLIGNISLPIAYGIFGLLFSIGSISMIMGICGIGMILLCSYLIITNFKKVVITQ